MVAQPKRKGRAVEPGRDAERPPEGFALHRHRHALGRGMDPRPPAVLRRGRIRDDLAIARHELLEDIGGCLTTANYLFGITYQTREN